MRTKEKGLEFELKALANKRRLSIIKLLKDKKELTVSEISKSIKLSFKSTSKHLSVLKLADIVEYEQRGLLYFYKLNFPLPDSVRVILSIM